MASSLELGQGYTKLKRHIVISIVNFKMFDRERADSLYQLREELGYELLTDKLELYYFELPKLPLIDAM